MATKKKTNTTQKFKSYNECLLWLYEHSNHERHRVIRYNEENFSLQRIEKLMEALGNIHQEVPCVHVAGTKGKGSTCAMLAGLMQGAGFTIGNYTSPHLTDIRERIAINDIMIPADTFVTICQDIAKHEAKLKEEFTFFEIMTAIAFVYFADQAVDLVILETGLGGRLDSTNICTPLVTAITQISEDHTNILGQNLVEIAKEKAGIFKKNVPAITTPQAPEVIEVLTEYAEKAGTKLSVLGDDIDFNWRFETNRELGPHSRVNITANHLTYEHLPVPLKGEHQALNCGLAIAILDALHPHGFTCDETQALEGLNMTRADARMEEIWSKPTIILDGAHNPASIQALIKALGSHIRYDSMIMIFGCSQDKDHKGMLEKIALGADKVVFTRAKNTPRSIEPADLYTNYQQYEGKMSQQAPNLLEALKIANSAAGRDDIIVITGSFYLAGEARKYLLERKVEAEKNNHTKGN